MNRDRMDRRSFLKGAALPGVGFSLAQEAEPPLAGRVPRKKLGSTGAEIPILLMGCSQRFDPQYDKRLHRAYKLGVDYLDTAQSYALGQSHKTIAPFIKQVGGRDKIWITSKVRLRGPGATPEAFKSNLDSCLADLETDHLDMFFMHMINDEAMLEPPFLKMGEELKKAGKTRFFGFSCHDGNVVELMNKAAKVGGIDAIMFRYSFRKYGDVALNKAIDACKAAGIGLIAMKTQGSVPTEQEEVVRFQSQNFTLAQAKLKAVWADERIDAAVSSMQNIEQVMENTAAAMSPAQLTMNEFVQLQRLAALTAPYYCHGCSHLCEAKIGGKLRIADALRYLMYHDSYGDPETARYLYAALGAEERDYSGADLAEAEKACPQGIPIARRLEEARRVLLA